MNANVSIYQDSVKDSSGILTSESNEIGSLKIIMPDKLNQLTARSSYICHIDDFVKGNKDYYGFDIQSDREMEYDYELIINKIKHINNNTGKHEYISIFNNFPVLGFMLCQIANLNDLRRVGKNKSYLPYHILEYGHRHTHIPVKRPYFPVHHQPSPL